MRRLLQRIYYLVESLFIRSPAYQLLMVAAAILVMSLAGGLMVYRTSPAFGDFGAAVWWAFLRLTDSGHMGEDQEVLPRLVSTLLTMAGYVVFLGALVAVMTTWLDRFLSGLASGRSQIFERGHFLIIGWNSRIHSLVEELVHSWRRVGGRRGRPSIAILCDPFEPRLLSELRQKLDADVRDGCRLQIRAGNPLQTASLERVDYAHARSIILVSEALENRSRRLLSDITLAKMALSLRAHLGPAERLPTLVVDLANPSNKPLVESMGWPDKTEAIASDEFIGQLFCQSVRYPGISALYAHLLTDTYGRSIVLVPVSELDLAGRTLRQALRELPSIPFGYLRERKEERLHLLELDSRLSEADEVVMIRFPPLGGTEGGDLLSGERPAHARGSDPEGAPPFRACWRLQPHTERDILVVGWSHHLYPFLHELSRYRNERNRIVVVCDLDETEALNRLGALERKYGSLELTFRRGVLHHPEDVRALEPERFHNVVLMASELLGDPLQADAQTVMACILVSRHLNQSGSTKTSLVVELNDEDNRHLLEGCRCDLLMTQEIVSHLLAQVAVRRSLAWIYEDLFTQGGSEIRFYPFATVLQGTPGELTFDQCLQASLDRGCVAVGLQLQGPRGGLPAGLHLNPPRSVPFRPDARDHLIVMEREEQA